MSRKFAEGTLPPTILEALEPRIAPAVIYVGTSDPNEGYSQSAFTKAANSPDPEIASLFAGSGDHYYLTLDSKSPVKFGDSASEYITVNSGKSLVFFYDKNSDGKVERGEVSGISLGESAGITVNDNVGGDALSTFNSKTGVFSSTTLQPYAKAVSKLAVSGSIDGSIVAAGSIANVNGPSNSSLKSVEQITTASDGTFNYNLGGTNVGQFTSTVVDVTGTQHIAYYDAAAGNLKYAKGSGSSWVFQTVDSGGDVGQFASIALTNSNNPVISYYDATNGDLKLATFSGVTWSLQTVDSTGDVGQYSSLELDASNNARIVYYDASGADLEFASFGAGSWSFTTIDSAGDVGQYASLAYDSTLDILHTSYHNATAGSLKYAQSVAGGAWATQTVDSTALVTTGLDTSIAVDPATSNVGISYTDLSTQSVHYAQGSSGGVFLPAGMVVVQSSVGSGSGQATSLAFNASGPAISYAVFDSSSTPHLEFASRSGAVWSHQTADAEAGSGGYSSLAFNAAGTPFISLYDAANKTLDQVQLTTPPATWSSPVIVDGVGVGTLAAFTPDAGKIGGSISSVTVGSVDKIVTGPGGAGAAGGAISSITIDSDTNGFEIHAGDGGAGKNGGNGGAVTGILVFGAVESPVNTDGLIKIFGGDGAAGTSGRGGAGGAVSKIYVGYNGSLTSPVQSFTQLLNDKVEIGGGAGGTGTQGGVGGALSNINVSVSTPNKAASDEISIFAGAGGVGTAADGAGGSIKTALLQNWNDKVSLNEKDDIRVAAGNAGDGAGASGANGGSVDDVTVLADHLTVTGGNGSAGPKKAGHGGAVSNITASNSDLDRSESITVTAGSGGAITGTGAAGNGGAVAGIKGLFTDLEGASLITGGAGGVSPGGKGGNGGSISSIQLFEPDDNPTVATIAVLAGSGGAGSAGGGFGGAIAKVSFLGFATSPTIAAGNGGASTLKGAGGRGGEVSEVAISSPSATTPISITAGDGGSGGGASGAGGLGGAIKLSNVLADPDITFEAGDGGNAGGSSGKAGAGGWLTGKVAGISTIGSVSMTAGSAGSGVAANSAAAGGSISSLVAVSSKNVTIQAGDGAWGGSGGSISSAVWYGITAGKADQSAAPAGDIGIFAGQGSKSDNGKLAGAGGSITSASGYASAGVSHLTRIFAGDGNGGSAAAKAALGGSITGVSLYGGTSGVEIRAGDGGDLSVKGTGGKGGSITGINSAPGVQINSLVAGDGGSSDFAKGVGGLGGSVTKVNVFESIGSRGNTGLFTSTAIDSTGVQHVAFYDATNGDLKYFDGTNFATVDFAGDVGQFASLKLTSADLPMISYYDVTNGDLKLAQQSAGGVWSIETVAAAGNVGQYSSLVINPNDITDPSASDQPRIAYYDATGADLEFASYNATTKVWSFATVDSINDVGQYASLAYDSTNKIFHTSYYDAYHGWLKYAQSTTGGSEGSWKTQTLDAPFGANTGLHTSIAVGPGSDVGISYFDATSNNVRYAEGTSSGLFLTVNKVIVATGVGNGPGQSTSLAFDPVTGSKMIAFQESNSAGTPHLRVGNSTFGSTTWTLENADSSEASGGYASLAIDASGTAFISSHNGLSGSLQTAENSSGTWTVDSPSGGKAPSSPYGIGNMGGIFAGAGGNGIEATGLYTSTAVDATGTQHISYYDPTQGNLKYAVGSGSSWTVSTVDSLGNVGQFTSIALTSTNLPVISYYDATNGDLKLATFTGANWSIQTVNSTLAGDDVGQFTSLELKADTPQIAYYDVTGGDLEFASFDGTTWTFTTVDSSGNVGKYDSLAYDPTGDVFHISYQDVTAGSLKYARSAAGGVWATQTVDAALGTTTGLQTSIAVNPSTHDVGISYINATSKSLTYTQGTSAGVFAPASITVVEAGIGNGAGQSTALAFGSGNEPAIAYGVFDTAGSSTLKFAARSGVVWTAATADVSAGSGQYASLAYDATGGAHVAQFNAAGRSLTEVHLPSGGAWSAPVSIDVPNGGIAGKAGNVTDITAKAIASIVAGRDVSPQLVTLVDKVYLRGLAAPTIDPADGSFTTVTDPFITPPTVNFFASNLVGGIAGDPEAADANQFKFVGDAPANTQSEAPPAPLNPNVYNWSLGVTQPIDGLVAAVKLTTNKNFIPQATLTPVNAKAPVKPTDPWVWSPTGYALADYRNNFTTNS